MESRSLDQLCCTTLAAVFKLCLTDDDLRAIGAWSDRPSGRGFSPSVWCRLVAQRLCHQDADLARRITDRLDLQFLDTIGVVRELTASQLQRTVELWLEGRDGRALPALLWALCTDGRDEVSTLGDLLGHEAIRIACEELVSTVSPPAARPA